MTPSSSGTPSASPLPSASARPTPPAQGPDALTETARVSFRLSEPLSTGVSADAFAADLVNELAAILHVAPHRFGNVSVTPGTLGASLLVLPPLAEEYAPESVGSVAARASAALGNASLASTLGAASALARVDNAAPVLSVVGRSYADLLEKEERSRLQGTAFSHSVSLGADGSIVLRWSLEDSALAVGGRVLRAQLQFSHDSWAAVGFKRADSGPSGMEGVWGILALPMAAESSHRAQETTLHNASLGGVVPRSAGELLHPAQMTSSTATAASRALAGAGASTHRVSFQRSLVSAAGQAWGISLPDGGEVRVVFAWGASPAESVSVSAMRMHRAGQSGQVLVDLGTGGVRLVPLGALGVTHGVVMFLVWYLLMPGAVVLATLSRALPKSRTTAHLVSAHMRMQTVAVFLCLVGFVLAVGLSANSGGVHFASPHQIMGLVATILPVANAIVGSMRPPKGAKGRGRWLALHRVLAVLTLLAGAITLPLGLAESGAPTGLLAVSVAAGVLVAVGVPAFAAACRPDHVPRKTTGTIKSRNNQRSSIVSGMNPLAVAHSACERATGSSMQNPLAAAPAPPPPTITITRPAEPAVLVVPTSPRDSQRSPEDILREFETNLANASFKPISPTLVGHDAKP